MFLFTAAIKTPMRWLQSRFCILVPALSLATYYIDRETVKYDMS
jgi:hypothetical protein